MNSQENEIRRWFSILGFRVQCNTGLTASRLFNDAASTSEPANRAKLSTQAVPGRSPMRTRADRCAVHGSRQSPSHAHNAEAKFRKSPRRSQETSKNMDESQDATGIDRSN